MCDCGVGAVWEVLVRGGLCLFHGAAICSHTSSYGRRRRKASDNTKVLAGAGGKLRLKVLHLNRRIEHWKAEAECYGVPEGHRATLSGTSGKRGRIALIRHTLEKAGIQCDNLTRWVIRRRGAGRKRGLRPSGQSNGGGQGDEVA